MQHDPQKEKLEASLIGKIFCMESLIFVMGCLSLWYGITEGKTISVFWGVTILAAFALLKYARKKDWKKHWEDLEMEQREHEERMKRKNGEQ